jgi:hypothetical protein
MLKSRTNDFTTHLPNGSLPEPVGSGATTWRLIMINILGEATSPLLLNSTGTGPSSQPQHQSICSYSSPITYVVILVEKSEQNVRLAISLLQ